MSAPPTIFGALRGGTPAPAPGPDERARIERAAQEFETLLVQRLLEAMREAQLEDGFFGSGPGSGAYQGMFDQHLAERVAADSPFGIARLLVEKLSGEPEGAARADRALRELADRRAREQCGSRPGRGPGSSSGPGYRSGF